MNGYDDFTTVLLLNVFPDQKSAFLCKAEPVLCGEIFLVRVNPITVCAKSGQPPPTLAPAPEYRPKR